jgi:hypothetical protein
MSIQNAPPLGDERSDQLPSNRSINLAGHIFEPLLIFFCFALYAGQLPPDVNESHYLTKAKHFWDTDWCPGDIFLSSSFSHWLFYVSTGWLTKFLSLSAVAWIGRVFTWALLAYAWRRLNWIVFGLRWVSVFTALTFLLINDRFHLAGEWVVGGFEAKGIAYFFVLLALGNLLKHDWKWVWPSLGAAAAFHVLVGGWAMLATMFASIAVVTTAHQRESLPSLVKRFWIPFAIGIGLSLLGAIPPLLADQALNDNISIAARSIYVNHRIAHHLSFDAFPVIHVARFIGVLLFWIGLSRWLATRSHFHARRLRPLFLFCYGSLVISFCGLVLSGLAQQGGQYSIVSEGLLRFYWFRLADFSLSMTTAMACCAVACVLIKSNKRTTQFSCVTCFVCIIAASAVVIYEKNLDPRPRADRRSLPSYMDDESRTIATYRNWKRVCKWINENTPTDTVFITPHEQQTFKWYTGRTEVVCWKDVPQDAEGILDWNQRLLELYVPQRRYEAGLMSFSDSQLREMANRYGADYLLVPQRHVDFAREPTDLKQVYPKDADEKSTYVVYEF